VELDVAEQVLERDAFGAAPQRLAQRGEILLGQRAVELDVEVDARAPEVVGHKVLHGAPRILDAPLDAAFREPCGSAVDGVQDGFQGGGVWFFPARLARIIWRGGRCRERIGKLMIAMGGGCAMCGNAWQMRCWAFRRLTGRGSGGMDVAMNVSGRSMMVAGMVALGAATCGAQVENPPPGVATSALAAVRELGDQVVRGNHRYAIDRMFPRWKKRMAKRLGGMKQLEKQLERVNEQMRLKGIHFMSSKPAGAARVFEVWPGKKTEVVDGKEVEVMTKTKWLLLIPTVTKFRIIDDVGKYRYIESRGFQIAISDKGKNDWYFMDGVGVTVRELRSLFPSFPGNVKLPPIKRSEVK
jgi:hypothetical protein